MAADLTANAHIPPIVWDVLRDDRAILVGIVGFAVVAALRYILLERKGRAIAWRDVLDYVFPRHIWQQISRMDISHFLLVVSVWDVLARLISLLISVDAGLWLRNFLNTKLGAPAPLLHSTWALGTVQFIGLYLSFEFGQYVQHRCSHTNDFLWSLHRPHHSLERLNFVLAFRGHFLENFVTSFISIPMAALVSGITLYFTGPSWSVGATTGMAMFALFIPIDTLLNHSHFPISFGKLDYVFQSPAQHQIHHSAELHHRDKNFGASVSIFDWMFGTLYIPAKDEQFRLGLSDTELGENNPYQNLRSMYVEPVARAGNVLWRYWSNYPDVPPNGRKTLH